MPEEPTMRQSQEEQLRGWVRKRRQIPQQQPEQAPEAKSDPNSQRTARDQAEKLREIALKAAKKSVADK